MYESEVNDRWEAATAIPEDVRQQWGKLSGTVTARSMLSWDEHCTECAIPYCFTTCELYQERRGDLACRRFTEGMVCVTGVEAIVPWLIKIQFKQWAKLWAKGRNSITESSAFISPIWAAMVASKAQLPWVSCTPFGFPVVPEV